MRQISIKQQRIGKLFVAHKKNELIEDFLCFKNYIILEIRKKGLPHLVQVDMNNKKKLT